jgi:ubiquinone/menaquinone biosynthesis C-methylase UbiE
MAPERDAFSRFQFEGWQRVADKYESTWASLTRLFIPELLQAAGVASGKRLLDVACGPGLVAAAAHALGARPIGLDFSPEMVRLARTNNPEIEFRHGDAQALDFEDESFDAVVMNFGVLHLPRPEAAFAEARRALRPGGRYGFTVWARPEESPGARIVQDAIQAHADTKMELPNGPDYFGYGDAEECRKILGRVGFDPASLVLQTVTLEWPVPSASFIFEAERDAGVRTAALLALQTLATLAAIQSQMERDLRVFAKAQGFHVPYAAHVVAVTRA